MNVYWYLIPCGIGLLAYLCCRVPSRFQAPLKGFLYVLPVLLYSYMMVRFASNVPYLDDYETLKFLSHGSWQDPQALFEQHNEHRIALVRLIWIAVYKVWGSIDFRVLAYLGNTLVLVNSILFLRILRCGQWPLPWSIPAWWLLWLTHGDMNWAFSAIQNNAATFFMLLALLCMERMTWPGVGGAIVCSVLAIFTSGSGIFTWMILTGAVLFFGWRGGDASGNNIALRNRWTAKLAAIVLSGAVVLAFYFQGYAKPAHHPSLLYGIQKPLVVAQYFFLFCGSPILYSGTIPLAAGVAEFMILILAAVQRAYRGNPRLHLLLVYFFLCAAAAAIARAGFGAEQALSERYKIISFMILSGTIIVLVQLLPERWKRSTLFFVFVMFGCAFLQIHTALRCRPILQFKQQALATGIEQWLVRSDTVEWLAYPEPEAAISILQESIANHIYVPPAPRK